MTEWLMPLLSLVGTLVGSLSGILVSQKMVSYKLEQLEKTVADIKSKNYDAHDVFYKRLNALERDVEKLNSNYGNIAQTLSEIKQDIKAINKKP